MSYRVSRMIVKCIDCGEDSGIYPDLHICGKPNQQPKKNWGEYLAESSSAMGNWLKNISKEEDQMAKYYRTKHGEVPKFLTSNDAPKPDDDDIEAFEDLNNKVKPLDPIKNRVILVKPDKDGSLATKYAKPILVRDKSSERSSRSRSEKGKSTRSPRDKSSISGEDKPSRSLKDNSSRLDRDNSSRSEREKSSRSDREKSSRSDRENSSRSGREKSSRSGRENSSRSDREKSSRSDREKSSRSKRHEEVEITSTSREKQKPAFGEVSNSKSASSRRSDRSKSTEPRRSERREAADTSPRRHRRPSRSRERSEVLTSSHQSPPPPSRRRRRGSLEKEPSDMASMPRPRN